MKRTLHASLVALALAIFVAPAAFAQGANGPLESRLVARKVVVADGRENFVDAADAKPGDVIEYVATYRNPGTAPIRNLEATLPIPKDTEFVAGSARPAGARASGDGETFAAMPLKRKARRADGKDAEAPVPLRDYRALRWYAGRLDAGRTLAFTARVRVIDEANPPDSTAGKAGGR